MEYDFYLSYYPPQIVDTSVQAAQGFRYTPIEHAGTVHEIVEFTEAEKAKIAGLIEELPPEVRQQFASKYEAWKATWDDPEYAYMSLPYWTLSEEYKQLVQFCKDQGKKAWPLLFQQLINEDRQYIIGSAIVDSTLPDYESILERIRNESQHKRYTEEGDYIAPSGETNLMKYAKELLALL